MGKQSSTSNERIIYKNSNNTFNTYSKICSSASKIFTKSLIMELKKNISTNNFYEAEGKIKRDLSVETDICKIVRFCRKNLKKPVNRLTITENEYFTNNTKMDTIDDFQPHDSSCGDSMSNFKQKDVHFNVDLTDLVMDNLKELLNIWIEKYLLENNKTKQKIETVLDSILHKLKSQASKISSTCIYALDIEIIDQQKSSNISESYKENQKHTRRSLYTIPLRGRHLQIISTLSLPRNLNKVNRKSLHTIKKHSNKYIYVSMKRNSMHKLGVSSLSILRVSTNTLTKQCATYKNINHEKHSDEKWTTYIPRSSNSTLYTSENYFDTPKTIKHAEDTIKKKQPTKEPSINERISVKPEYEIGKQPSKKEINCIEKQNHSQAETSFITYIKTHKSAAQSILNLILEQKSKIHGCENYISNFDNKNQNIDIFHDTIDKVNKRKEKNRNKNNIFPAKRIKKILKKNLSKKHIPHKVVPKTYSYSHKKPKSETLKQNEITKQFQTVLQYFANSFSQKDLKFDIHINIFPENENVKKEKKSSDQPTKLDSGVFKIKSNREFRIMPDLKENTVNQILKPSMTPLILPLLSEAISPVKYLKSKETSTENCDQLTNKEKNTKLEANKINITHEICDLREIATELKAAAEKIIKAHLSNKNLKNIIDPVTDSKSKNKISKIKCDSRGIQLSYISPQSNITSGLKLQKSPRNRARKDNPRLVKKSTSYHIINSETILKVTDMTSAAVDGNTEKVTDEALTCSFPKSKSLFEVSIGSNKHKLIAFYCDDFVNHSAYNQNLYSTCSCIEPACVRPSCSNDCMFDNLKSARQHKLSANDDMCSTRGNCGRSSSILINVCPKESAKKFTFRNRRVGSWEGCCYCVLLWIPVIVILFLLYKYVLQDLINKITKSDGNIKRAQRSRFILRNNESQLAFRLSDLGF